MYYRMMKQKIKFKRWFKNDKILFKRKPRENINRKRI